MSTALPVFGVVFAAAFIWLTVRLVNRRERWAKWTLTVAIASPVLYVASFGPACWLNRSTGIATSFIRFAYRPLWWVMSHSDRFRPPLILYAEFGASEGTMLLVRPDDFKWVDPISNPDFFPDVWLDLANSQQYFPDADPGTTEPRQ